MIATDSKRPRNVDWKAAAAILSLMPLDSFIDNAAQRMEIVGSPDEVPAVQQEVQAVVDKAEGKHWPLVGVERFAFYERARTAAYIVATTEFRLYGNLILKKGVVHPHEVYRG